MNQERFTSIDLFAGAGGLSCGLQMAGFKPLAANEWVPVYAETYKKNHPDTKVSIGDIRETSAKALRKEFGLAKGQLDLIAGGPPCQGFSVNAPIRSLDDPRNHLFKDFLDFVQEFKPKAVLIENVPGIVSLAQGTVVNEIYKSLDSMGYSVDHKILFAGHYGVPQTRFRTVFIALDKKHPVRFPSPKYNARAVANFTGAKLLCQRIDPLFSRDLKEPTSISDALSDLPPLRNGEQTEMVSYATRASSDYQKILRKGSRKVRNHSCSGLGQVNLERVKFIPQGGNWTDIPFEMLPKGMQKARKSDHTKRYGRLSPNGFGSTILTKCDPHWGAYIHPDQDRILSVREAARIQSFPDSYRFLGSTTEQYAQVGNAVPPLMAKAIGDELAKSLREI